MVVTSKDQGENFFLSFLASLYENSPGFLSGIFKKRRSLLMIKPIEWKNGSIRLIDQRELPGRLKYLKCDNVEKLACAIETLAVRGAPLIAWRWTSGIPRKAAFNTISKALSGGSPKPGPLRSTCSGRWKG
jgi:hypothetical protein